VPSAYRRTGLGIREVPEGCRAAGEACGSSRRQWLTRSGLPDARPSIAAGMTQCIMLSLSMVVIAALVGAGGLGKPVVNALNTADIAIGFEAGLAIVLLAVMLERICKQPEAKVGSFD
ncbi:ABC transporter permease subunit, partial [Pseudomonas syringae]